MTTTVLTEEADTAEGGLASGGSEGDVRGADGVGLLSGGPVLPAGGPLSGGPLLASGPLAG